MSLNTPQLKTDLKAVYTQTYESTGSAEAALDAFLDELCDKLEVWAKTATVVYTSGLTAGANAVIGTFNGHIE